MSTKRTCQQCSKEFVQTFGGRPRKKCYDCVPARLNQKGSTAQKTQRENEHLESTVGKHTGNTGANSSAESSGRHCPECGSYPAGGANTNASWPFCNPQHRARFAEKVARAQAEKKVRRDTNGRLPSTKLAGHKPPGARPLERVRKREQIRADEERSQQIGKAREKQAASEQLGIAA